MEANQFKAPDWGKEDQYYELYVGCGNYQYVCKECQKKPFKEVMAKLGDEVYPAGGHKTLEELTQR